MRELIDFKKMKGQGKKAQQKLNELRNSLKSFPTGGLSEKDQKKVTPLLAFCWNEFEGANDTKMADFKLNRVEDMEFVEPSTLKFAIERHGGTVLGSIYAELQYWTVNIDEKKAEVSSYCGKRLLYARDKPYTKKQAGKDARSVADSIINNKTDLRLKWMGDSKVRVLVGKIVIETNQWTTTARRKRLRSLLEELLKPLGWKQTCSNIYEKNRQ